VVNGDCCAGSTCQQVTKVGPKTCAIGKI
jgi:hypothetical protein